MSSSRDHAVPAIPRPFRWHPGDGLHPGCLQRMRAKLRRPAKPMGEAWFMGEDRHMFVSLLGDLERCSSEELRAPLEEIASGIASFGPMDEWTDWYRYLLAQLVARHPEQSFDSLYQRLVTAFIAVHPRGIDEPYPGFADDARQTLGRCLMDPSRWSGARLALAAPQDPFAHPDHRFAWSVACGDFSAGMVFCTKYLASAELPAWLDSAFAIQCPLWTTQLHGWLLGAYPLLSGRVPQLAALENDAASEVAWLGTHVLKGDFSGDHAASRPPLPLLSEPRFQAVLDAARRHVSEARYFAWLDAIKPYPYLETLLGGMPSRFAEVFEIA
jgi:hypothetical protein